MTPLQLNVPVESANVLQILVVGELAKPVLYLTFTVSPGR
jgi:hypothetical protein